MYEHNNLPDPDKNQQRAFAAGSRRRRLLAGYLINMPLGASSVRELIQNDMQRFAELGADQYASDLEEVLVCFEQIHKGSVAGFDNAAS